MNQKQKRAILIGLILFVLMFFFPPCFKTGLRKGLVFGGYQFILLADRVDVSLLMAQWFMVAVVTGGAVLL